MIAQRTTTRAPLLLLALAAPLPAGPAAIADLAWLAGCWAGEGEPGSGEYWLEPAGGAMLGLSRTIRDGTMAAFEYLRIAESAEGSLVLTATPSGQATTEFVLAAVSANAVVFENAAHDFPQRVSYRLTAPERLLAEIAGTVGGEERRVQFSMVRIGCEPRDAADNGRSE